MDFLEQSDDITWVRLTDSREVIQYHLLVVNPNCWVMTSCENSQEDIPSRDVTTRDPGITLRHHAVKSP